MTRFLDAGVDISTTRLIKTAQGIDAAGLLPPTSGRTLVRLAKSVRLLAEAMETELASDALHEISSVAGSCDSDAIAIALSRQIVAVRKAMRFSDKQDTAVRSAA